MLSSIRKSLVLALIAVAAATLAAAMTGDAPQRCGTGWYAQCWTGACRWSGTVHATYADAMRDRDSHERQTGHGNVLVLEK